MTTTVRRRSTRATTALALVLVLAAATTACGDEDSSDAATPAESSTIEITAVDYGFENLPREVRTGAALALRNRSVRELHELVAMRLPDGEQRTAAVLAALPPAELGALSGGPPALALIAPPEKEAFAAVGNGTLATPGRYLLMCFIPIGANAGAYLDALKANPGQPPSVPGGAPHFTAGMYAEVTVR